MYKVGQIEKGGERGRQKETREERERERDGWYYCAKRKPGVWTCFLASGVELELKTELALFVTAWAKTLTYLHSRLWMASKLALVK